MEEDEHSLPQLGPSGHFPSPCTINQGVFGLIFIGLILAHLYFGLNRWQPLVLSVLGFIYRFKALHKINNKYH